MASAKLPTPDELKAVGRQLGMNLSDGDVGFFLETMGGSVAAYHAIEAMADPMPPVKYPRTPGYRPEGAENKFNAWYYKSEVQGAPGGPGGLDPHPGRLLRRVRSQPAARPRAVPRHLPHRAHTRPHGSHDRHGGRQRAAARGAGRTRRARSAPGERQDRRLHQRADR